MGEYKRLFVNYCIIADDIPQLDGNAVISWNKPVATFEDIVAIQKIIEDEITGMNIKSIVVSNWQRME